MALIPEGARDESEEFPSRPRLVLSDDHPEEDKREWLRQMARAEESRWQEAVPLRFWEARLSRVEKAVADEIRSWLQQEWPGTLLLVGPVGTGKTYAGVATLRYLMLNEVSVLFRPLGEMLDELRPGGDEGARARLVEGGVLMIDDLGSVRSSEWAAGQIYSIVNRRWLERDLLIATSNLPLPELETALGERTFSRLVGSDAVVIRMSGGDRRRTK